MTGGRAIPVVLAAVVAMLALAGCGAEADDGTTSSSSARSPQVSVSGQPAPTTSTSQHDGSKRLGVQGDTRAERPVRVAIPAIGVDAPTTDLGIDKSGHIEVPSNGRDVGWLTTTPAPGQQGPSVLAGHVDTTTGPAVFYRLSSLSKGDTITVTQRDGSTVRFTVDGVRLYRQDHFPSRLVYGPVPGPELRLITCGGQYIESDGGYQDNVVVYAS